MKKVFVDTNYFLRFLIKDESSRQKKTVENLFYQAVEGELQLFTNSLVFFEVYWVLTSFYQITARRALESLGDLLKLGFIQLEDRALLSKAIKLSDQSSLELEDCFHLLYAIDEGASQLATFDKKLRKLAKVRLGVS